MSSKIEVIRNDGEKVDLANLTDSQIQNMVLCKGDKVAMSEGEKTITRTVLQDQKFLDFFAGLKF